MALTITTDLNRAEGLQRSSKQSGPAILTGSIAFDSSYPTGGEELTDLSKHFKTLLQVIVEGAGGYVFEFDKTNNKIVAYSTAATQVTNGTDLSGITGAKFIAFGFT